MYFATAIPHYRRIIDVRFYVSLVEDFSGVDVDDMLRERERERERERNRDRERERVHLCVRRHVSRRHEIKVLEK